jgi:exonuclease SbcC
MIPLQLTLKNFLSYREATLDFRGLHVACICGANGAGKSSLLEAIAWAVWGQGRAASEDDLIHLGTKETQVDFVFSCHEQTYRILRSRYRNQTSALEFQIQTQNGFRSLTARGVRATQQLIREHIKLDYDTFINSAYLRQGRADEFMLKRPGERKQILADLLKLDQYDLLADQAKERSRQYKAEMDVLERTLAELDAQLQQHDSLSIEQATLEDTLKQLRQQQDDDLQALKQHQANQQQRQRWQQDYALCQQRYQHELEVYQRLQREQAQLTQQQQRIDATLSEAEAIAYRYAQMETLQHEDDELTAQFQIYQTIQARRQQLEAQLAATTHPLTDQLRTTESRLEALVREEHEVRSLLEKIGDLEPALDQLRHARQRLGELDQLQMQVSPLLQRQLYLQQQIQLESARLTARLDDLETLSQELQVQQQQQPRLQQSVLDIASEIESLERRRVYQQQVREKGTERRNFLERLQERQRDYERQLAEWDAKIRLLQEGVHDSGWELQPPTVAVREPTPDYLSSNAWNNARTDSNSLAQETELQSLSPNAEAVPQTAIYYPPCPLCDRPLDQHHWQLVLQRHQAEYQEALRQLWVVREQLAVSEREIQILRQEYRELEQELANYNAALERRGQLQAQLHSMGSVEQRLQFIQDEEAALRRSLHEQTYARELHDELNQLTQRLQQLNYDDKTHALVRGEVERWRWAEIKQAEVRQAQRQLQRIVEQRPQLEAHHTQLCQQLQAVYSSPLQLELNHLDYEIAAIGYDADRHAAVREILRQAQVWQFRYQELRQAQQQAPQIQQQREALATSILTTRQTLQAIETQLASLTEQLEQQPDCTDAMQQLENQIQERRSHLDQLLAQLGRLQHQRQHYQQLQQQRTHQLEQQQHAKRQKRIYAELAQAFGKNGIQSLMIETVLPQLEAESNQILSRLSANQLHVQFVTQRAGKRKLSTKLIDTLDILIADTNGTRPYETYSGGEAFRVNFAIRLALARLLAQQSGTTLQMLIIDEGFGTQDKAGCDRLIRAINAIASDFACILTVTHMPHLKEAFQTRIEVEKAADGSKLHLLM